MCETNRPYQLFPVRVDWSMYSEPQNCAGTADVLSAPAAKKFKGKRARLQLLAGLGNKVMTDRDRNNVDD